MKKLLIFGLAAMVGLGPVTGQAEEADSRPELNWEISMMPKPTEKEQEAERWSVAIQNNLGVYAYDRASLTFSEEKNGTADRNIISILTKTVFTDKDTVKKLNEQFKEKLAKKETTQYCEILMTFNLADKTYAVTRMDVFGNKKTLLQHVEKELQFVPVPEGSFAEAMLEICQQAVAGDAKAVQ